MFFAQIFFGFFGDTPGDFLVDLACILQRGKIQGCAHQKGSPFLRIEIRQFFDVSKICRCRKLWWHRSASDVEILFEMKS